MMTLNPMNLSNRFELQPTSYEIWDSKYRLKDEQGNAIDKTVLDSFKRVAGALAKVEIKQEYWYEKFLWAMLHGAVPAGRVMSNAGAEQYKPNTSTINCVVSSTIEDNMDSILTNLRDAGMTLKNGSGIGYDFSTLRPRGAYVAGAGAYTSGPLSFMDIYDKMCFTISSAGGRRGAQMATFDIRHPDVIEFIQAKREAGRLRQFNLSLLITHSFMEAVKKDQLWDFTFPLGSENVYRTIRARELWNQIMQSNYEYAEPGFLLIDEINRMNNNWFCEEIRATNPCFTGDTLVFTNHGLIPFKILAARGGDIGVLTEVDGRTTYRMMRNPRLTQQNAQLVKVNFLTGGSIRCTPNHKFYLENGDAIEAKDLREFIKVKGFERHLVCMMIIESVEHLLDVEDVYCGTVEEVSKFYVSRGSKTDGVLVSNCGEQPLPPNGSCLLGSIDLTQFVRNPFTSEVLFDWGTYADVIRIFTRMLDNVVEINGLPLEAQRKELELKRRHGMGYFGLGSVFSMMGCSYGSEESIRMTRDFTEALAIEGYITGLDLAKEKGPAPIMNMDFEVTEELRNKRPDLFKTIFYPGDTVKGKYLHANSEYMKRIAKLEPELVMKLEDVGCRFTHHSSIAPTGTLALSFGNNASNGIEPSFSHHYVRNVIVTGKKTKEQMDVYSKEALLYLELMYGRKEELPDYCKTANQITPKEHIDIQAAAQYWIDSSISKTVNVPSDCTIEQFQNIYQYAYDSGLKGCATFRFNPDNFQGVLVNHADLDNTTYQFILENGETVTVNGSDTIEYEGETHGAANLFDALKEGLYGKF